MNTAPNINTHPQSGAVASRIIKLHLSLAILVALSACNKQSASDASGLYSSPAQAIAFKGEMYQTLNQDEVITLVSTDELEHRNKKLNLVCKYTKQGDTLRVVESVMGTTQAIYYKITPEGLRMNNGEILYSPTQRMIAQQRQEEERRQIEAELGHSRVQSKELDFFDLRAFNLGVYKMNHSFSPKRISISDVSVILEFQKGNETLYFADFSHVGEVRKETHDVGGPIEELLYLFQIRWRNNLNQQEYFDLATTRNKDTIAVLEAVVRAYVGWSQKFPHAGHPKETLAELDLKAFGR